MGVTGAQLLCVICDLGVIRLPGDFSYQFVYLCCCSRGHIHTVHLNTSLYSDT